MKKFCWLFLTAVLALAEPIELANVTINPKAQLQAISPLAAGLYVFQPREKLSKNSLIALESEGVILYCPVPPKAYIVKVTEAGLSYLKQNYKDAFLTPYLPEWKCAKSLNSQIKIQNTALQSVTILATTKDDLEKISDYLHEKGIKETFFEKQTLPRLRANLSAAQIAEISKLPEVAWIEPYESIKFLNAIAAATVGATYVRETHGLTGKGEMVMVADTGLDSGNYATLRKDFSNKRVVCAVAEDNPTTSWGDTNGHGTHVAGTAVGCGYFDSAAKGIAPEADLYFLAADIEYDNINPPTTLDLETALAAGAHASNNSWYSVLSGDYLACACFLDIFMYEHPDFLLLFAAGNSNSGSAITNNCRLTAESVAKNIITVGASIKPNSVTNISPYRAMASFSSRGPTSDGRVKPDISAPGTSLLSCVSQLVDPTGAEKYTTKSGTSMATPVVTGASALVREFLRKEEQIENPSASLIKALLLNGARKLLAAGLPPYYPNWVSGYGELNLTQSLYPTNGCLNIFEGEIQDQETKVFTLTKNTDGPVSITLAWTDYPGNPSVKNQLVNDLDLVLETEEEIYPACDINAKNNVESIAIDNLKAQTEIFLKVKGSNVLMGPQAFSIAATGFDQVPEPTVLLLLAILGLFFKRTTFRAEI